MEREVRLCGVEWTYCDGQCGKCTVNECTTSDHTEMCDKTVRTTLAGAVRLMSDEGIARYIAEQQIMVMDEFADMIGAPPTPEYVKRGTIDEWKEHMKKEVCLYCMK